MKLKERYRSLKERLKIKLAINIGVGYVRFVGLTSKVYTVGKEYENELQEKGVPIIYSFWHNTLFFFTYMYKNYPAKIMTSTSRDAEIITGIMDKQKIPSIRGSSTRGGLKALLEMIEHLRSGGYGGITPDGPKGPKYEIKEGIIYAAKKSGAYILPIINYPKRKIVFNSWDNFMLPLPFNEIVVVYGKPISVKENDDIEEKKKELKKEMMRIVKIGEEFFEKSRGDKK